MHKKKKILLAMFISGSKGREFKKDNQELKLTTDNLRVFELINKYNYLIE